MSATRTTVATTVARRPRVVDRLPATRRLRLRRTPTRPATAPAVAPTPVARASVVATRGTPPATACRRTPVRDTAPASPTRAPASAADPTFSEKPLLLEQHLHCARLLAVRDGG